MEKILYIAISNDKYELPMIVTRTASEMARWSGTKEPNMSRYLKTGLPCTRLKCKFIRLEMEDETDGKTI